MQTGSKYSPTEKRFGIEIQLSVVLLKRKVLYLLLGGEHARSSLNHPDYDERADACPAPKLPAPPHQAFWSGQTCPSAPAARTGGRYASTARQVGLSEYHLRKWARRFCMQGVAGLRERPRSGRPPVFAPQVALYVVKLACERPDQFGRSLSQWDCSDLARQLTSEGIVPTMSFETVRRILQSHKLKPWRSHMWLSPKVPRDQHFAQQVHHLVDLYTRPLAPWER